ncbi:MAG: N-acetyltransferase [Sulfobacillus benefaciens]|uniref:N-acetyltransferase n=1 Tax=Sulfobacillus benefaciens TaxID=453960 RepID=A0A2T2XI56_9FIRM|nr:MAG: N-acetyltransferase [Sulfobacillus benefaciens]
MTISFLNRSFAALLEIDAVRGTQQIMEAWETLPSAETIGTLHWNQGIAVFGGKDCPINEAIGLGMEDPVTVEMLDRVEAFYESYDYPSTIRVCSLADPSLIDLVQQRGYRLTGFTHRWVLDLTSWKSPLATKDPRVHAANLGEEMLWARTMATGFSAEENDNQNFDFERALFRMSSGIPVIAFENGLPAGAGMLAVNDGIAALFATSTQLSFRRKGLHMGLLDWRLRYAQQQGMRWATIETDPGSDSQRNVERMGFRLAYVTAELTLPV